MKVHTNSIQGSLLRLSLDGDLDASSSVKVDEVIGNAIKNEQYQIIIDCNKLNYISSAGIGVFISHLEDFKQNEGDLVFFNMKPTVYSVFELLGLHKILPIVSSEQDAVNTIVA